MNLSTEQIKIIMRTQEQIANKIKKWQEEDIFGFKTGDLLEHLDYAHAKDFLKPEVTEEEWSEAQAELSRESILKKMEDYMEFAWDKANSCRGISAGRSLAHYT